MKRSSPVLANAPRNSEASMRIPAGNLELCFLYTCFVLTWTYLWVQSKWTGFPVPSGWSNRPTNFDLWLKQLTPINAHVHTHTDTWDPLVHSHFPQSKMHIKKSWWNTSKTSWTHGVKHGTCAEPKFEINPFILNPPADNKCIYGIHDLDTVRSPANKTWLESWIIDQWKKYTDCNVIT